MERREEDPLQDERLGAIAVTEPGASDKIGEAGGPESEQPTNGLANSDHSNPSTSSDLEAPQEKGESKNETPPRSSLKTGLIMASLCVSAEETILSKFAI